MGALSKIFSRVVGLLEDTLLFYGDKKLDSLILDSKSYSLLF